MRRAISRAWRSMSSTMAMKARTLAMAQRKRVSAVLSQMVIQRGARGLVMAGIIRQPERAWMDAKLSPNARNQILHTFKAFGQKLVFRRQSYAS
jgi:hypothetical protein